MIVAQLKAAGAYSVFYRNRIILPQNQLREKQQRLIDYEDVLCRRMRQKLQDYRYRLNLNAGRMKGLSPLDKLSHGFSYTENLSGKAVTGIDQVTAGEQLKIQVTDGAITARVEAVQPVERG